ncbi:hypothetical protein B0F90DRAFT_657741 [Multifurca ochricompacta]|uniref:Uncharacterized protein n=1 Tax=Multifurca ochricompacta TaxID=376703 RepID=A0AAD4M3G3_9AGAM|nr:hypothetical protein B0F90DRAFT_657741 [Multifurca ochricompacta]
MASVPSKRWTQFYAALQLAIQRAAHKWTYKDFSECFPLWCEEQPNGAEGVFNTVSNFIESHIVTNTNKLFEEYEVQKHIDTLHEVVTDARARRQRGEGPGVDHWRVDLQPRAAVRARTIPALEQERDSLRARLAEMERENTELYREVQENVAARDRADTKTAEIFAFFDEIHAKWKELPIEDVQAWTLLTAETQSAVNPPP